MTASTMIDKLRNDNHAVTVLALVGSTLLAYLVVRCFYNYFFHPLAVYPGPKLAAISELWYAQHWLSKRWAFKLLEASQKYGEVIRIAPNELFFTSTRAFEDIYGHANHQKGRKPFLKSEFYDNPDEMSPLGAERDPVKHRDTRKQLAHSFSESALSQQLPYIMRHWFNWLTFDIIGDLAFGESFHAVEQVKSNPAITALMNVLFTGSVVNIFRRLPILLPFAPLILPISELKKEREMHQEYARELMQRRIAKGNDRADFFGHLLKNEATRPSEEFLRTNASSLLIAGSETTATALVGMTYYLLERPECLSALQEEVRSAFKTHQEINESSTRDLRYVDAVIKEALRIFVPLPINVPRVSPGAFVDGRYIPAGYSLGHSPQYFTDPESFHPERWLPESHPLYNQRYANDNLDASKPFLIGPRTCLGKNLAYLEMRIILSKLVLLFDWEALQSLGPGKEVDWNRDVKVLSEIASTDGSAQSPQAKKRELGLRKVAPVSVAGETDDKTTIDIIAIHGLGAESPWTWEHKARNRDGRTVNWLADSDMLPSVVPEASIYTYDWNAHYLYDARALDVRSHATSLLALVSEHQQVGQQPGRRPIIFIASCFGGLVLIDAINHAAIKNSPYRNVLVATAGCVFLATPFQGSDGSAQARWRMLVENIVGTGPGPSDVLVQALDRDHENLIGRAQLFAVTANADWLRLPVYCFFENMRTELLRRYVWFFCIRFLSTPVTHKLLVTESSACLDGFGRQALDANHSGMNKFDGPHCTNFRRVKEVIKGFADGALSAVERRMTPKGDPSPTPYWNDSAFMQKIDLIGRDKEIASIHSHLSDLKTQGKRGWVCLWGPGGIGKTQLAAAYALEYEHLYSQVFKICGDSPESIQENFARLADDSPLVSQGPESTPPWPSDNADAETRHKILQRRVRIVHHWFQTHKEWLLVIDDIRFQKLDLFSYIPKTNHGAVIITSQSRDAVGGGMLLEVPPLDPGDAATLLLNKANKRDQESRATDLPRADKIAELLGYLPLAVEHAGALIGIKGMEYFWETFHSSPITILDQSDITSLHQASVFRTFKTSFDVLKERNLCAAKFLVFLAFLANTTISSEVFLDEGGVPRPSLRHMQLFQTKAEFDKAVSELHALALIKCKEDHTSLSLHSLVHYMVRARLPIAYFINWTKNAAEYLCWPLLQPQPVPSTTQLSFSFKSVLQILKLAAELDIPEPLTEGFLRLWDVLGRLLLHYYLRWHAHGGMEELECYSQRAIAVLEQLGLRVLPKGRMLL
ncbi:hypothetical protein ACJZ2D_016088 [Fusarium nematophilum]